MGHVRQEFGLVLGHQRELLGLLLERGARFSDLAIFNLEERGLILQLLGAALELGIGALQLLQELFGAAARADHVEDNADAEHELLEEGDVDLAERLERAELDDPLHLSFEDDGQYRNVPRRGFADARTDLNVFVRYVRNDDGLLLSCGLAHETLADGEGIRDALASLVAIGAQERQHGLGALGVVKNEEGANLA